MDSSPWAILLSAPNKAERSMNYYYVKQVSRKSLASSLSENLYALTSWLYA